ncbi:MAG: ComF family protein [Clostridia bacterium]|nr:ComF family protein [Lachnospiraceae bacterium]NCC01300.1 ComF family protein [Clostridia bacterium]NCD03147.1 ComF family protein [Clostridia bacterium]
MKIINLIFPPHCPLCGELLALNEGRVHKACYKKLPWVKEPLCKRCGKPISSETGEWCLDCFKSRERHSRSFDSGRALWLYKGDIQKSVLDYKYKGLRSYTPFYGEEASRVLGSWIRQKAPQVLVPVPLHPRKKRIRGFNQAELLARDIGKRMNIPVDGKILRRNRWTEPQKALSDRERRHNLTKSMEIHHLPENLKRVMLVDDIYTTGSTMEVCGAILKKAGVEKVYFLTLCIGFGEG